MKPVVAIIGRPNVGKSALFNRLIRRPQALVDATPGLTRDRLYGDVTWNGVDFQVVDTGGLEFAGRDRISEHIALQVARAMEEASVALFVVDCKLGPLPLDREVCAWAHKWGKPVLLVANKADNEKDVLDVPEFSDLGLGLPHSVSALHGKGIGELLDAVVEQVKIAVKAPSPGEEKGGEQVPLRVAILGRPNVGKSSIINRLLNEERVLVDDVPGTTRDPVEVRFTYKDLSYRLVDTAGVRSQRTLKSKMDAVARMKALEALRRADVCVLVLEAPVGIIQDDLKLLDHVVTAGRPLVLAVNKWDLLPRSTSEKSPVESIAQRAPFVKFAPVICVSAKTGFHLLPLFDRIAEVAAEDRKRLTSGQLKDLLEAIRQDSRAPAGVRNAQLIRLIQSGAAPPTFQLLARVKSSFRQSDMAYLERALRSAHGFAGAPLRLRVLEKKREWRDPDKRRDGRGRRGVRER